MRKFNWNPGILIYNHKSHNFSCRINRILQASQGYALLIGVGGSGKQSLARLAAFISNIEVYQLQLRTGYGVPELKVTTICFLSQF